jgi:hypothetical protein
MRLLRRLFAKKEEVVLNQISPNVYGLDEGEDFRIEFDVATLQEFINMTRLNGDDVLVIENEKGRFEVYTKKKSNNDRPV